MKDADLVAAYLAHAETATRDGTDAEHFAAREELDSRITDEPERRHPHAFIDRVEALAKQDAHFSAGGLGGMGMQFTACGRSSAPRRTRGRGAAPPVGDASLEM